MSFKCSSQPPRCNLYNDVIAVCSFADQCYPELAEKKNQMFTSYDSLAEFNNGNDAMNRTGWKVHSWQYYPAGNPVLIVFWIDG